MVDRVRRSFRASGAQAVTFVELFFDLVFVFAVTQLTAVTAHDLTPGGILRSILLGWLIWWAWTQFTWTLNPADTTHPTVRVVTLAATAVALVMSASVQHAFGDDALWFALPYVVVRVLGMGLQIQVELERVGESHGGVIRWVSFSVIGLILVLVGAGADPSLRPWIWLLAIVADVVAAAIAGRNAVWDMDPAHLSERHGLFVIIAIGESLIIAGTAVANVERTVPLEAAAGAAILVAALLWWTYFGWLKEALEHAFAAVPPERNGPVARDAGTSRSAAEAARVDPVASNLVVDDPLGGAEQARGPGPVPPGGLERVLDQVALEGFHRLGQGSAHHRA